MLRTQIRALMPIQFEESSSIQTLRCSTICSANTHGTTPSYALARARPDNGGGARGQGRLSFRSRRARRDEDQGLCRDRRRTDQPQGNLEGSARDIYSGRRPSLRLRPTTMAATTHRMKRKILTKSATRLLFD